MDRTQISSNLDGEEQLKVTLSPCQKKPLPEAHKCECVCMCMCTGPWIPSFCAR